MKSTPGVLPAGRLAGAGGGRGSPIYSTHDPPLNLLHVGGTLAAAGLDLFVLHTDGVRPTPGMFIVMAGFMAAVGLVWLAGEVR
jgi:hypothetical protein